MPRTDFDEVFTTTGQLLKRVQRTVSDAQIAREQAPLRVREGKARLEQIVQQADAVASGTGVLAPLQVKTLAAAIRDLARFQQELIMALGRD